jgi:hypothetical protein
MLFIVLPGIVGAGATFFALWPYGAFSAFFWPRREATTTSRDEMSERVRLE